MATNVAKVLVVDDHAMLRLGTRQMLDQSKLLQVVGDAGSLAEAMDVMAIAGPDVVLMDIRLPDGSGLDGAGRIMQTWPETKVIILSAYDDDDYLQSALKIGVAGYLLKTIRGDELVKAVEAVAGGVTVLDPSITERLVRQRARDVLPMRDVISRTGRSTGYAAGQEPWVFSTSASPPADFDTGAVSVGSLLTSREQEIVCLLAMGLSNKAIANRLVISVRTVEGHLNRVFSKLGLSSRTELLRYAIAHGLADLGSQG